MLRRLVWRMLGRAEHFGVYSFYCNCAHVFHPGEKVVALCGADAWQTWKLANKIKPLKGGRG